MYPRNLEHGSGDSIHHAEDEFLVLACEIAHDDRSDEGCMLDVMMMTRRRLTNQDCRAGHATKLRERQEQPSHGTEEMESIPRSTKDMVDGCKLWNTNPTSMIPSLTSSSKQEWLFLVVGESEKDRVGAAIPHKRWPEHRWSDWLDLASEINHDLDGCDLRLAALDRRNISIFVKQPMLLAGTMSWTFSSRAGPIYRL